MEPEWTAVGRIDEFPEGRGRQVRIGARRIGVYRHAGAWFALKDSCPHAGLALHSGLLCDGAVACPGHGWTLDLASGQVRKGGSGKQVASYPVRLVGDVVEVGV